MEMIDLWKGRSSSVKVRQRARGCVALAAPAEQRCRSSTLPSVVKNAPVCPLLKEIRKKAIKPLFLQFREIDQLLSRLPLKYLHAI